MLIIRWLSVFLVCAAPLAGPAAAAEARDPHVHFFHPHTGDLKAELADAKSAGKKAVFVMFEQEGCPGCIYMKEHVLNRPDVQKFYRARFVNLAIDAFGAVPLTDFSGISRTEKAYAQAAGIQGTPTLLFHDLDGKELLRIVGPVKETEEFLLIGEFIASGAYKSQKLAEFRTSRRKKGS